MGDEHNRIEKTIFSLEVKGELNVLNEIEGISGSGHYTSLLHASKHTFYGYSTVCGDVVCKSLS